MFVLNVPTFPLGAEHIYLNVFSLMSNRTIEPSLILNRCSKLDLLTSTACGVSFVQQVVSPAAFKGSRKHNPTLLTDAGDIFSGTKAICSIVKMQLSFAGINV